MKQLFYTLLLVFSFGIKSNAQLSAGTIAPDFTVTDINGNSHHLYDYLNAGKHVILDFSATWCGPCWAYHNSGVFDALYEDYGPNGSDDIMIIYLESENNNSWQCLYGPSGCTGPNGGTQGNWVVGTDYPIVDLSVIGQNALKSSYAIAYFPTLYAIDYHTKKIYPRSNSGYEGTVAGWESLLFGSFEMSVSTSFDNSNPCPLTASITATTVGGANPISYNWSNSGGTTSTITNVPAGTYRCTVTDANSFSFVTAPVVITSPPAINSVLTHQQNVSCFNMANGELSVNATGGNGGFNYNWSNGQSGPALVNLPNGSYTCTATDAQGCSKTTGPYLLTQPALLTATANTTNPACGVNNGIVTMFPNGGTSPYQYTLNTTTQNSAVFTNLSGGTLPYTIVDSKGCNTTGSVTLLSSVAPLAATAAVGSISCLTTTAQVSGNGSSTGNNFEYQWTTTNGNILSGANDLVATVGQGGAYQLAVRNVLNGCITNSTTNMTSNTTLPTSVAATVGELNCTVANVNLNGTGSSTGSNYSYLWTTTNGNITAGATTLTPTVSAAGSYNLKVTNSTNGCVSNAATPVAQNIVQPTVSLPTGLQLTCTASSVEICGTSNGSTLVWSNGGTQTCTNVTNAGTYTLTATGTNGCTNVAATTVTTSSDLPQVSIAAPAMVTCSTPTVPVQGTVANSGTYAYLWTTIDGMIESGSTNLTAIVSSEGTYNLRVTNTASGCVTNQSVVVNEISAAPAALFTSTTTGTDVSATANTSVSTTTFNWTLNGTSISTTSSATISIANPGTYILCMNAANDCGNNNTCQTFTVLAPLSASASGTQITCFNAKNGTAKASITGGLAPYTYAWTGPNGFTATTAELSNLAPGVYTANITDANNNSTSVTVTISEPTEITVATSNVTNDNNGQNVGAVSLTMTGGTAGYAYLWSNGAVTQNLTNVGAGTYTCAVTDANGCPKQVGPFVVANVSGVDEAQFISALNIYPNPATSIINLNVSFKSNVTSTVRFSNSLGQLILTRSYASDINDTYEVGNLPTGVYNVTIMHGEYATVRKVIVTK